MTADIIIENARVLTLEMGSPRATAIALKGGTILAVGDRAKVAAFASSSTKCIDAGGATVMPGIVESHIHLFAGGAQLDALSLSGLVGLDEIAAAVRGRAATEKGKLLVA